MTPPANRRPAAGGVWLRGRRVAGLLALLAPLLLALPAGPALAQSGEGERTIHLTLYALGGDTVLYRGVRIARQAGGRTTVGTAFTRPDGTPVQHMESVFETATLAPVSYRMRDARSGEEELLERSGASVTLTYRATGTEAAKSSTLDWTPEHFISATVEPLILREWARLAAGEQVPFRLLVPSRRDAFQFRLLRDDASPLARPGHLIVRMEPGTWLVRRLVDPLFFVMETAPPHRLREFHGRSTIKTDDGKDQDLRLVYSETP